MGRGPTSILSLPQCRTRLVGTGRSPTPRSPADACRRSTALWCFWAGGRIARQAPTRKSWAINTHWQCAVSPGIEAHRARRCTCRCNTTRKAGRASSSPMGVYRRARTVEAVHALTPAARGISGISVHCCRMSTGRVLESGAGGRRKPGASTRWWLSTYAEGR
ncbi:hypothetical protein B0H14DRAFT_2681426 [Mycena olivaceomarginata]|nr:hypothetical protein B0H14DRAFT_2681426 [Mycena olivaceomarginata]